MYFSANCITRASRVLVITPKLFSSGFTVVPLVFNDDAGKPNDG